MAQRAKKITGPPVTAAQIKKLHALKNALKLNDETYRAALDNCAGVASSKDLTIDQATGLIDDWQAKATATGVWEIRKPKPKKFDDLDNRRGMMATPPQLRMIEGIWQEVSRAKEPEGRKTVLRHFIARIAKVSDLRFLDRDGASAVINALVAMQKSGQKQEARKKAV
jgi:hypothetical protein